MAWGAIFLNKTPTDPAAYLLFSSYVIPFVIIKDGGGRRRGRSLWRKDTL